MLFQRRPLLVQAKRCITPSRCRTYNGNKGRHTNYCQNYICVLSWARAVRYGGCTTSLGTKQAKYIRVYTSSVLIKSLHGFPIILYSDTHHFVSAGSARTRHRNSMGVFFSSTHLGMNENRIIRGIRANGSTRVRELRLKMISPTLNI